MLLQEKIKERTSKWRIRPESDMEKQLTEKRWRRDNSPSPVTYNKEAALEKTTAVDKGNRYYSLKKETKDSFVDIATRKSKNTPGVGKYDAHLALDKVFRPSMRKR